MGCVSQGYDRLSLHALKYFNEITHALPFLRFNTIIFFIIGTTHFIIHARNCILNGLSPAQNRTIPPLNYDTVRKLQEDFPELIFELNGGVQTCDQALTLLHMNGDKHNTNSTDNAGRTDVQPESKPFAGIMIGRAAYANPWILADADALFAPQVSAQAPESYR